MCVCARVYIYLLLVCSESAGNLTVFLRQYIFFLIILSLSLSSKGYLSFFCQFGFLKPIYIQYWSTTEQDLVTLQPFSPKRKSKEQDQNLNLKFSSNLSSSFLNTCWVRFPPQPFQKNNDKKKDFLSSFHSLKSFVQI